jgi:uncharacterized protein (DUF2249 family)
MMNQTLIKPLIVNRKTKISEIISANPSAIEAIASVNSHFTKLKNPVLRKLLAPRVTLEMAAQVGNSSVEVLLQALKNIGFEIESNIETPTLSPQIKTKNKFMNTKEIIELDVRPILESGVDPFKAIMDQIKVLPMGASLCIINTFEPIPLINKLKEKGFSHQTQRNDAGEVRTFLYRNTDEPIPAEENIENNLNPSFDIVFKQFENNMIEIDVRALEMPMPMVTILESIEQLEPHQALYVHHKRLPQYLLPELEQRLFAFASKEEDADNTKLIIYRKNQ